MSNTDDKRLEISLLKAMSVRKNFDAFIEHIDFKRLLPNTELLLKDYKKYFSSYEDSEIDWNVFFTEFSQHWHKSDLDNDDIEYYRDTVIPKIYETDNSSINNVLVGLLDREYSERISKLISNDINTDLLSDELHNYAKERAKYIKEVDDEAFSIDRVDFSVLDKDNGIPWFLPELQAGLGSLVQGQLVVVSASHGVGKSAFVISQAVEAFKHLHKKEIEKPILYFNSEGTQADVFARFLSNLYYKHIKDGFEEVFKRIDEIKDKFMKSFDSKNFLVFQIQPGDMSKIRQKIDMYRPSVAIIDIADVLTKDEDVQSLKRIYDNLRLISAEYCPILATTQAGNTSYQFFDKEKGEMVKGTRKWLTENDLYGSKAGKGGAADTIITIGKDDDMNNVRYINTPKIKRGHIVRTTCELLEQFSLYKEL